jgi:hypothetical protein
MVHEDCNIGNAGAIAMADALKLNSTVVSVDLGGAHVPEVRVCCRRLRHVRAGCAIDDAGAIALASSLASNSVVGQIDLQCTARGAAGVHVWPTVVVSAV